MMNKVKTRSRTRKSLVLSGWVLLVALLIGGVLYGPEVYGLLRVSGEIDTVAHNAAQLGGPWPRSIDSCLYCHDGAQGNGRTQLYPRLAGQPEAYLRKQLTAFASGERSDPTMTPFALSLSESEFTSLVANFSKMKPQPNATFHADAARVERGAALAKSNNCASCHGQQLEGKDTYPRLAGQSHDYVVDQLTNFRNGTRRDAAGVMAAVASGLSQADIDDLAHFLASR